MRPLIALLATLLGVSLSLQAASDRLRVIIETDAGGDPDDEQSLVRFLLYANEWDVEGIIANRPTARDGENRNRERTGLGVVQQLVRAYGEVWTNLVQHDSRYPSGETLLKRVIAGADHHHEAVDFLIRTIDSASVEKPIWYSDWGTDHGASTNSLRRALDKIRAERGQEGYAKFKSKIRPSSSDAFGDHTWKIEPPFPFWIDTFEPEINRKRWYHQFSIITAKAGGFDAVRDVITGHGPLGALYPTNTTHWLKEGDSMTFIYLIPTGMNHPDHPEWGSWAGRYGLRDNAGPRRYYWANQEDAWNGSTNRNNTLARWAEALQNDFKARMDWCVRSPAQANHPPVIKVDGASSFYASPGDRIRFNAAESTDPDQNKLSFSWEIYRESGSYKGSVLFSNPGDPSPLLHLDSKSTGELHLVLSVTDDGSPKLTRYHRSIIQVANLKVSRPGPPR